MSACFVARRLYIPSEHPFECRTMIINWHKLMLRAHTFCSQNSIPCLILPRNKLCQCASSHSKCIYRQHLKPEAVAILCSRFFFVTVMYFEAVKHSSPTALFLILAWHYSIAPPAPCWCIISVFFYLFSLYIKRSRVQEQVGRHCCVFRARTNRVVLTPVLAVTMPQWRSLLHG